MKKVAKIVLDNEPIEGISNYGITFINPDEIELELEEEDIKSQLESSSTYLKLIRSVRTFLSINKGYDDDLCQEYLNHLNYMQSTDYQEYFSDINTYTIVGEYNSLKGFIESNKSILDGKTIQIANQYDLTDEDYKRCINEINTLSSILPNSTFKVFISGNTEAITVDDYKKVLNIIDNIVNQIKSLNLSQLEQIMFIYDLVKSRVYTSENKDDGAYKSRDLSSVLLGDKIVCVGYTVLFNTILNKLNIYNTGCHLDSIDEMDSGHIRSIVFVDDLKYKVKGFYFFDPTWDSKRINEDNYMNKYLYFARTSQEMLMADRKQNLNWRFQPFLDIRHLKMLEEQLPEEFTINDYFRLHGSLSINHFLELLGDSYNKTTTTHKKEELLQKLHKIYASFNNQIKPETFIELLYNVKKIEYYLDPSIPFSIEDFKKSLHQNKYYFILMSAQENFLVELFFNGDKQTYINTKEEKVIEANLNEDMQKRIESIKLTRTLKNILQQKTE